MTLSYQKAEKKWVLSWRRVLLEAGLLLQVFGERGRVLALPSKATDLSRESISLGVGFESLNWACGSRREPSASCSCHGAFTPWCFVTAVEK